MLVLSRKTREEIVILDVNGNVLMRITVVEIREGKVRLGFVAEKEIPIHRREVYDKIIASQVPSSEGERVVSNDANIAPQARGLDS